MRFTVAHPFDDVLKVAGNFDRALRNRNCAGGNCDDSPVNMELVEEKDGYKIYAELPGLTRDDINITLENDELTISGEKKRPARADDARVMFTERSYGRFSRAFRLSENSDREKIAADFRDGILVVTLPHREETKPKEIKVTVN